jgi:cold shock CspA family protein
MKRRKGAGPRDPTGIARAKIGVEEAMSEATPPKTGRVKWFNAERGYGFIVPDGTLPGDNTCDLFYHVRNINGNLQPKDGERCSFYITKGLRHQKLEATLITLTDRPAP